tara:strand:- start:508 stop:1170 length:663 start_codon:yes stop_codon:yes gene_type:complete
MSLLDQAAKNLSPYKAMMAESASKNDEVKFIIQPNILMDILKDEMDSRAIDKKMKKQFAGFRTRLKTAEWRLAGMLNYVDEEIYRVQIGKTLESMMKHIKLVQPNGDWVLLDYEADIRPNKNGDQSLMLAASFVDTKNENDMKYQNGIPSVDVNVDVTGSNKELIEAIQAQGGGSDNAELIATLNRFINSMTPQNASVEENKSKVKEENVLDEVPGDFSE